MSDQIGRRRLGMRDAVVVVLVTLLSAGCGANPELPQATPASTTAAPPQRAPTPADTGKPCTSVLGTTVTVQVAGRPVAVHLPVCYQRSSARYPAIYLLHGAGADETQWLDVGAATASDELTRTGVTKPAILVIPDIDGLPAAAADRFVIESLLPWVDQHYRTMADARHRSIGGISRGGGTALRVAAARPDLFSVVGGHSPATGTLSKELVQGLRPYSGRIWLDVGTDDSLAGATASLDQALRADGTKDHLEVNPGGHDRTYWRAHTSAYLTFYGTKLKGT